MRRVLFLRKINIWDEKENTVGSVGSIHQGNLLMGFGVGFKLVLRVGFKGASGSIPGWYQGWVQGSFRIDFKAGFKAFYCRFSSFFRLVLDRELRKCHLRCLLRWFPLFLSFSFGSYEPVTELVTVKQSRRIDGHVDGSIILRHPFATR